MRQHFTHYILFLALLLRGSVANGQVLTASAANVTGFTTAVGATSARQGITVDGTGLLTGSDLTATASAGIEVAWYDGNFFSSAPYLNVYNGTVTNQALYIRLTGAVLGPVSGSVSISSPGAATIQIAVSGVVTATPTVNGRATFSYMTPNSAGSGAPFRVSFHGSGFVPGAEVGVVLVNAGFISIGPTTFVSPTELTALVRVRATAAPVTCYLYLNNPLPGGGSTSSAPYPGNMTFTVVPAAPVITSFSPTIGPVGTTVEIRGYNLSLLTASPAVFFNGLRITQPPTLTPDENVVTYRVPVGATTGPITLTNINGTFTTSVPFVVPPVFFEDFETGTKTSYIPASVPLFTMGWTLAEALIGTTAGVDKFNGLKSARLRGGGFVEMDVDKPNGAGVVTVSAASYATETGASFVPEISTDGGVTYTSLLGSSPAPTLTSTLTPYSFTANRTGNVRLRFSSTNTAAATNPRINIDDIGITDYRLGTATKPGQALPELRMFPNPAAGRVTVQGAGAGPVRCSLSDVAGRQLLAPVVLPADGGLALPATLPAGLYLLQVETPAGRRTLRLATQ